VATSNFIGYLATPPPYLSTGYPQYLQSYPHQATKLSTGY
jgi:hypothetical protein